MNLYEALGISLGATQNEIKTAYLKQSSKHHPDKGGDSELFKNISLAYKILTDSKKRQRYDNDGTIDTGREYDPAADLGVIFSSVIDEGNFNRNIITSIKNKLVTQLSASKMQLLSLESSIKNIDSVAGRVSTTREDNLFACALDFKKDLLNKQVLQMKALINNTQALIEYLGSYSDNKLPPDLITTRSSSFSNFNTGVTDTGY